ncbi:hypothetical protein ABZ611_23800 [Streptomyces sp. NPDC007861]|uniref:WD40 repeat domain-containing protein n=1 Tax=Streptomyces sp. NPDC007861 TaxID=3154893 RepID=UPI003408B28A
MAPDGPRLCLTSGDLERAAPVLEAAHAVVSLAGQSGLGAAWALANRLGVVARTPAELVQALTAGARRTVIVLRDLHAAGDPGEAAELIARLAELGTLRLLVEARTGTPARERLLALRPAILDLDLDLELDLDLDPDAGLELDADTGLDPGLELDLDAASDPGMDPAGPFGCPAADPAQPAPAGLDDPAAVCAADPVYVTAAYAHGDDDHGGLRPAWLRAGQALSREQSPAERALVLLAALGDGADPRHRPTLAELAAATPWRVVRTRVQGDLAPPWPGPVTALAPGAGPLAGRLLAADRLGTVRVLDAVDATPVDRLTSTARLPKALASLPDGTVLLLDRRGLLHAAGPTAGAGRLTDAVRATLSRHPGTALATVAGAVAVGDRMGSVHAFGLAGVHQAALHSGRVTALTAVELPAPVIYSGGADGVVRAWSPGHGPVPAPLVERPHPVTALHATAAANGPLLAVAWADGLVELRHVTTGDVLPFRPGPPVRAVTVTGTGTGTGTGAAAGDHGADSVAVGMDEALVLLSPCGISGPTPHTG